MNKNGKIRWCITTALTFVVIVFSVGGAWAIVESQVNAHKETITDHEQRLRTVEQMTIRFDEKLTNIQRSQEEIKEMLKDR